MNKRRGWSRIFRQVDNQPDLASSEDVQLDEASGIARPSSDESPVAFSALDAAEEFIELGLTGLNANNLLGQSLQSTIDAVAEEIRAVLPKTLKENRLLFLSRGQGKLRWFPDPTKGHQVQKDEYAENVPQAMLDAAQTLGWSGIVVYAGRMPEFDDTKPSFETLYPGTAFELDYRMMGSAPGVLRSECRNYFNGQWEQMAGDAGWQDVFSYRGVGFHDQLEPMLDSVIAPLSSTFVAEYARWKAVFQVLNPKAVWGGRLDTNSPLLKAAEEEGVLTSNIKLGIGEEMLAPFYLRDEYGEYDKTIMPDLHLLWGTRQSDMLDRRFEGHPSHWVPVGRTRNDSFVETQNRAEGTENQMKAFLEVPKKSKIILFGANHRTFYARDAGDADGICCLSWVSYCEALKGLENCAAQQSDLYVVVKPHPSDDIPRIEAFVDSLSDRVRLVTNASGLHNSNILADSDIFVSSVTSMFSEALVSDCLPISLWLDDVNYLYESDRREMFDAMAVTVNSIPEMIKAVQHYLGNAKARAKETKSLRDGLKAYFGEVDGRNAERAIYETLQIVVEGDHELATHFQCLSRP